MRHRIFRSEADRFAERCDRRRRMPVLEQLGAALQTRATPPRRVLAGAARCGRAAGGKEVRAIRAACVSTPSSRVSPRAQRDTGGAAPAADDRSAAVWPQRPARRRSIRLEFAPAAAGAGLVAAGTCLSAAPRAAVRSSYQYFLARDYPITQVAVSREAVQRRAGREGQSSRRLPAGEKEQPPERTSQETRGPTRSAHLDAIHASQHGEAPIGASSCQPDNIATDDYPLVFAPALIPRRGPAAAKRFRFGADGGRSGRKLQAQRRAGRGWPARGWR